MSNAMVYESEKHHILLLENDKRYNLKFNEHFIKYFKSLNNFKNIQSILLEKFNTSLNKNESLNILLEKLIEQSIFK
jgi:hypothetical protein